MIEGSGIRRMFGLIASMDDPVNLSIGQAHFDVPEPVRRAAREAIDAGHNRYTVTQGLPELRTATAAYLADRFGAVIDDPQEQVLITSGVSGGLSLGYFGLTDPGDEVVVMDPFFVMYPNLLRLIGVTPQFVDTYPDWRIREDRLRAAINDRTRAIQINSPGNPTGAVLPPEDLEMIARVAREHDLWVIADEIYGEFVYDGDFPSFQPLYPEKTLLLGGWSKTWGAPGWRLGWAVGPAELVQRMAIMQQFSFVCAPAPLQHAALEALDTDMSDHVADYRARRARVLEGLGDRYEIVAPGGSFYMFPRVPGDLTGTDFVGRCVEEELLVVPGDACSRADSHFRLSFAADDETLDRGIAVLNRLADDIAG